MEKTIVQALKMLEEKGFSLSDAIKFIEKNEIGWSVRVPSYRVIDFIKGN